MLLRPEPQSTAFAEAVAARLPGSFRFEIAPLMRIAPVEAAKVDLAGIGALLFTSANGVEQFARRSAERSLPAFCVGAMTAAAAQARGFEAQSAGGNVEALAELVIARHAPESGACLHVRGIHAAGDLAGRLAAAGIAVRALALYDQVAARIEGRAASLLACGRIDVVTFFSPRTAALFAGQAIAEGWPLAGATSIALSAAADAPLVPLGFATRRIARFPGRDGMIAALGAI